MKSALWIPAVVATLVPSLVRADVKVEKVDYHGWTGCYRISNPDVELIVVPQVGRVMRYGYPGKDNMLWENPDLAGKPSKPGIWTNYGGDKLWPAPQSVWNWPPDYDLDGSPWKVEVIPSGLRMTSPDSKKLKLRLMREITLAPFGTAVHFRNRMDNLGPERQLAPWQVTQIDDPYSIFLPTESTSVNPRGYRLLQNSTLNPSLHQVTAQGVQIKRDPRNGFKIGGLSTSGELTASKGMTVFHMKTKIYRSLMYPDGNCALEVFTSGDPDKYAELELLGPLVKMDPSQGAYLEVDWRLSEGK